MLQFFRWILESQAVVPHVCMFALATNLGRSFFLSPMDGRLSRIRACHFVANLVLNGESGLDQHGKLFE